MSAIEGRAERILANVKYATVATSDRAGGPWNTPVAHFFDRNGDICWFSAIDAVHSENIRMNKNVFIVVYDSTMPEGTGEGVYIQATAREINDVEELKQMIEDSDQDWTRRLSQVTGDGVHRYYKATPIKTWINDDEKDDDGNYVKDIRIEVDYPA